MHNKPFYITSCFLFLLIALSSVVSAQEDLKTAEYEFYQKQGYMPISGEQYGDYPGKVYLITSDIIVPSGKTLTFYPQSTLILTKDTKIIVHGKLIAAGTPTGLITITNHKKTDYYLPIDTTKEPRFDGINLLDSGIVEMSYVSYSKGRYGIQAAGKNSMLILDTVMFWDNKYFNVRINGDVIAIPNDKYISYNSNEPQTVIDLSKKSNPDSSENKISIPAAPVKQSAPWKAPVRISLGVLTAAGAGMAVFSEVKARDYNKKTKAAKNTPDADLFEKKGNNAFLWRNISAGFAGGCLTVFTVTLFF
jgi:hypothetical protein